MTFAERLKSERKRLGITQAKLAEILEMSKRWVEETEAGRNMPPKIAQEGALKRLGKLKPAK